MRILLFLPLPVLLASCAVADAAIDVAKLPVKAVGAGIDAATTTQAEADEDRGRAMRKAEEDYGRRVWLWAEACDKLRQAGEPCPPKPDYIPPPEKR